MSPNDFEALCRRIVNGHPRQADAYRHGKSMRGFFVGDVMRATGGTVSPVAASAIFRSIMDVHWVGA
jgi:Asp-tRNA(Asn)/Glu-tRNA(Gln) amidotransferase B subunit